MGHIVNPVSFRVGVSRFWSSNWCNNKRYSYYQTIIEDNNIFELIQKIFLFKVFLKYGNLLFSNVKVYRHVDKIIIIIYLFNTKRLVNKLKFYEVFKRLSYKFGSSVLFLFYKQCFLFIREYFKLSKLFFNFVKKSPGLALYDILVLYSFFLVRLLKFKKFSIFFFFKFCSSSYKPFFNYYITLLFFRALKSRFWQKLSFSICFFLKKYISLRPFLNIRFCRLSFLGVNSLVVGRYIVVRLAQRFRLMEIIAPAMRKLKKDSSILGFKFSLSGRFTRKSIATYEWYSYGPLSLSTKNAKLEYTSIFVILKFGVCGIKIWINRSPFYEKNVQDLGGFVFWSFE